jgi:FdhD protein
MRATIKTPALVRVVDDDGERVRPDELATEEPLEIRLVAGASRRTVAITMRTPGADFELAAGFLLGEGVIAGRDDIRRISHCADPDVDAAQHYNIVNVDLRGRDLPDLPQLERHFSTTSACGVCGKATLEALELRGCRAAPLGPELDPEVIHGLPDALRAGQRLFSSTGGLHAAGLFAADGTLLALREDVGRHNAVDKAVGWALLEGRVPLHGHVLMVSGRSSYEIVQKAIVAGLPVVCAVSAPSSLAVSLAREFGVTLVGFLRDRRFNLYAGDERIRRVAPPGTSTVC